MNHRSRIGAKGHQHIAGARSAIDGAQPHPLSRVDEWVHAGSGGAHPDGVSDFEELADPLHMSRGQATDRARIDATIRPR
ncbi:MAG: hypothetical protein AAFZ38_10545 [Myxococcota bacterium]